MSDQLVNLSDDELRYGVKQGLLDDPANLNRIDSDSRRRLARVRAEQNQSQKPSMRELYDMQMSSDPGARSKASAAAKQLTWPEQQEWNTFQKAQHAGSDRTRVDNSVLGMPPELAVTSGLGVARAAAGTGLSMAGRAMAATKEAAVQAAPAVKYELTKTALRAIGIPDAVAIPVAIAVSGYRSGKPPAAAQAPAAETAAAEVAAPAAPAPSVPVRAKTMGTKAPRFEEGKQGAQELEDLLDAIHGPDRMSGIPNGGAAPAAGRVNVPTVATTAATAAGPRTINDAMKAAIDQQRARAASPAASTPAAPAPTGVRGGRGSAPTSPTAPAPAPAQPPTPAADKPKLSSDEAKLYVELTQRGTSHQQAMQAIEAQRSFAQKFGLQSPADVRTAVADRNVSGRWPE